MKYLLMLVSMCFLSFSYKRLCTYLHFFQQEEYDSVRFVKWMFSKRVFDTKLSLILLAIVCVGFIWPIYDKAFIVLLSVCFVAFYFLEKNPNLNSKKKLILTNRIKRILFLSILLTVILIWSFAVYSVLWRWLIVLHLIPCIMMLSNIILIPIESYIQKRYWLEAKHKLDKNKPFIIGITGSYGKTSVKHIIGHILQMVAPTLITPGSVNTVMGITRVIRSELTERHKYFVVEMGAYQKHSIDKICQLTPPNAAIITSIGHAHYERFKTLDKVAQAKFELAEQVLLNQGKIIISDDIASFDHVKKIIAGNANHFVIAGELSTQIMMKEYKQTRKGIALVIAYKGHKYNITAPLYGEYQAKNILLSFAIAVTLGIEPNIIVTALKSVGQIPHRLQVKSRGAKGVTIDDAYNSNPIGFEGALKLLGLFREDNNRTILITPGMVELGEHHDLEHQKAGKMASKYVDVLIAVIPDRIKTLVEEFKSNMKPHQEMVLCSTLQKAHEWLRKNMKEDDIVLYENDLPDLYEKRPRL